MFDILITRLIPCIRGIRTVYWYIWFSMPGAFCVKHDWR